MRTLFISAKSKNQLASLDNIILNKMPKKIALFYSIQFKTQAEELRKQLKTKKTTNFSQVLGCSKPKISKSTKAILLIGSGRFHGISLAQETNLPVFILENNKLTEIFQIEVDILKQKQKASLVKYFNAKKIGILISTKPGQENLTRAINLKKSIKNKSSYLYIANEINPAEFENFPQIESWVNTACPRMDMNSSKIINSDKIKHSQFQILFSKLQLL